MRYKVRGQEIRSENAAKPISQAAEPVLAWLKEQPPVAAALDYGCGKLRYAGALAMRCEALTVVDSCVQLRRTQRIGGHTTSVLDYVQRWRNARALTTEQFESDDRKYGLTLCANVLSAIPCEQARANVLDAIRQSLAAPGKCLFVTQYRNSYFQRASCRPQSIAHLDGWLLPSLRGCAYYGLISLDKLVALLHEHDLRVVESWVYEGSAYAVAGLPCAGESLASADS